MQGKITKRAVDTLQPSSKNLFLWDDKLSGFGLKVTPSGRKIYILQYRMGGRNTPSKRYTIGLHGPWTPDTARKEATEKLGEIAKGDDPALPKVKSKGMPTLKQFGQRFLREYAELHKKPRSVAEDRRNLQKLVYPQLGSRRLDKVTRQDIARLHRSLHDTPIAANRTLAVLSTLFNYAESDEVKLRPENSNPCRKFKKYDEKKRERKRFLSEIELSRLGNTLRQVEKTQTYSPFVIAAIRLLVLTGARLGEVLTLKWDYVDHDRRCLNLPDSKTGQKTVFINAPALQVLESILRLNDNPYVLPGHKHGTHLKNIQTAWRDIRKQATLDDVRLHDLRHAFASVGVQAGMGLPIIGGLLGHTQPATTQRYAHLADDPLKQATEVIGERLQAALSGNAKSFAPED